MTEKIKVNQSYNKQQIEWFKAGGALNVIRRNISSEMQVA
jgi:aconitate hydratase